MTPESMASDATGKFLRHTPNRRSCSQWDAIHSRLLPTPLHPHAGANHDGKYNHRNWSYFGILDPREKTFGHLMKEAGYRTCIAGKWQLQSYDPPDFPNADLRRGAGMRVDQAGFDEHCLFHSWDTEDKGSRYADPTYFRNGSLVTEEKENTVPTARLSFS